MPYYSEHTKQSVSIWAFYILCPNYDRATQVRLLSHTWFSHDFIFSFIKLHSLIMIIIIFIIVINIHHLLPKSAKCSLFCSCFSCSSVCNSNLSRACYMSLAIWSPLQKHLKKSTNCEALLCFYRMTKLIQLENVTQLLSRTNIRASNYISTCFNETCLMLAVVTAESEMHQFLETLLPFEWSACSHSINCNTANSSCRILATRCPFPKPLYRRQQAWRGSPRSQGHCSESLATIRLPLMRCHLHLCCHISYHRLY